MFFERVLYFGWPNQPSSGTMQNFPLYLKKAGLASRNIVRVKKNILFVKPIRSLLIQRTYEQDHRSGCLLLKHFIARRELGNGLFVSIPKDIFISRNNRKKNISSLVLSMTAFWGAVINLLNLPA